MTARDRRAEPQADINGGQRDDRVTPEMVVAFLEDGMPQEVYEWMEDNLVTRLNAALHTGTESALDPDMPAQALLLAMGELTASEVRVARAAIRWANSRNGAP